MLFSLAVLLQFALWLLPVIAPVFWRGPWLMGG